MLVRVFRNLTRDAWSIQTRTAGAWRTVAHASAVAVDDATFYASEASRIRCAATGQREVHAWIQGTLSAVTDCAPVAKWKTAEISAELAAADCAEISALPHGVNYRPFVESGFRMRQSGEIVKHAPHAVCRIDNGCTVGGAS